MLPVEHHNALPEDAPEPHAEARPVLPAQEEVEILFGRHIGPTDLAERRKDTLIDVWTEKRAKRDMNPLNHLLRPHGN